jgi:hypothetical protein
MKNVQVSTPAVPFFTNVCDDIRKALIIAEVKAKT